MDWQPTTAEIAAYRRATGCPLMKVRPTLQAMTNELRRRVLLAVEDQDSPLHDPIQDEPDVGALIRRVSEEVELAAAAQGRSGIGTCHFIWNETARILLERHDVQWFSPAHMNPNVFFD